MKKYFVLFSQRFSEYSTYRVRLLVTLLQGFVTPLFLLLVLSHVSPRPGFTTSGLVSYFLLVGLIYPLTKSKVNEFVEEYTTSGDVNNFLVKPLSFYKYMLANDLSWKILNLLTVLPFIILTGFFILRDNPVNSNVLVIGTTVLTTIISFLISFNFSYLVGLFSFWLDEFWAINNVKFVVVNLLGGVVLPYTFFPGWATLVLKYSPFPYMITWPVRVIQGQFESLELLVSFIWLIVFAILIRFFQNQAIQKYSHTAS